MGTSHGASSGSVVEVERGGRLVPLFPVLSSVTTDRVKWDGVTLHSFQDIPACEIPEHVHPTHTLSLLTSPQANVEWTTGGRTRRALNGAGNLRNTPLKLKSFLHNPGDPIDQVYFPGGGFVSVVTVLKDGSMVEVVTIGREGMLGTAAAVLNGDPSPAAAMVQAETDVCYTMSADAFREEMDRRGAFYELVTRYEQALVGFIMQSAACNASIRSNNGCRAGCCSHTTASEAMTFH
jgi:hypothetical protein